MTTSQKVWLGFGTLTALLVLSGATIFVRVRAIEGAVREQMHRARLRSVATRELERHAVGYALGVQEHGVGAAGARERAAAHAAEVERHLADYEQFATTRREHDLAAGFAARWRELYALGQALLRGERRTATPADQGRFIDCRARLERFLDEQMQPDAVETYARRSAAALADTQAAERFILVLLAVGVALALLTSATVGRAIVRGERAVAEKRERLRTTLASIADAVITTDAAGRVTALNAVAELLTGQTSQAAVGQPLDAVFRLADQDNPAPGVLREGVPVGLAEPAVLVAADGTRRPVDGRAAPIRDRAGGVLGCVLVFRDVTERQRADAALRASESTLRSFYESSPLLMGVVEVPPDDSDVLHVYDSPATERFFGRPPGSTAGKTARGLGVPPDAVERWVRHYRASQRERRPVRFEYAHPTPAGPVWLSSVVAHIGPAASGGDRFSYVTEDVTERKRMEEALKEADRRKDEFLATLAHELRNPLAPIRNALRVIRLSDAREAREEARAVMERQLAQMVRLLDDLMDVSRITRGRLDLRPERVDLAAVIHTAVETSRPLVEQMGHELTVTPPPQPLHLHADPTRLAQVLTNLLGNAARYTEPGGRIWLTAERHAGHAVLTVRDTGIGIPREALGGVFDLFAQVDRRPERARGGLGVGLSLARRLVELHGGTIDAASDGPGRGSTFTVRLPISDEAAVPDAPADAEPAAGPSALRVLVVDDNRDSADSLAMLLRLLGNDVRTAYDGAEAVAAVEASRPDVVLLDLGMPTLNGYDACRRIRELPGGGALLLVALTGWGQEEDVRRSREAGFDHHLVKPVDPSRLMRLLAGLRPARA